jgi:small GTP-binding protein
MIQKKICLLGSFGVGKTSLVSRFVHGVFSEKYLSTVGVKIDRKDVSIEGKNVRLMVWDIHGQDEFQEVRASYLRGMAGYFLVVDGTRPETLSVAMELHKLATDAVGNVPFVILLNKSDLDEHWQLDTHRLEELVDKDWTISKTSAKTGENVEAMFVKLAERIVSGP